MKTMVVTPISNWQQDENGKYEFDEEGIPLLIDEDHLGMVLNTHVLPISSIDPETKGLKTELLHRLEVAWNNDRCPALALENPNDLVFMSLPDEEDESSDQDDSEYEDETEGEVEEDWETERVQDA